MVFSIFFGLLDWIVLILVWLFTPHKLVSCPWQCQCIQHLSTNWGHYFYVSYWRRDRHFTWSCQPREGLAVYRGNVVPSFLSYFKIPSTVPVPRIGPRTSRSAIKRPTNRANPAAVDYYVQHERSTGPELHWTELGPWLLILNPCVHLGNYCVILLTLEKSS